MPRKKDNTLGSNYGPQEGVDAAHSRSTGGATIRQHGFDAPATKHVRAHTVTVREAAGKIADWVNSRMADKPAAKPAAKPAGLKKKRR